MVFMQRRGMKYLRLRARIVARTSNLKISRRRLVGQVKKLRGLNSKIPLCHSTNHIIDL